MYSFLKMDLIAVNRISRHQPRSPHRKNFFIMFLVCAREKGAMQSMEDSFLTERKYKSKETESCKEL